MQNYKRMLSIFLLITFISANIPIISLAQGMDDLVNKVVSSEQISQGTKKQAKILEEIEAKRERNVKHFIREDRTYEAVVYPFAAHYKENGTWKDIDNNIRRR